MDSRDKERMRIYIGSHVRVLVRATGRRVEVELEGDELRHDILSFLLEEGSSEPGGLQAVDRLDQLRLPGEGDVSQRTRTPLGLHNQKRRCGKDMADTYCSAPSTSSITPAMMVITRPTAPRIWKKVPMRPSKVAALATSSPASPASVCIVCYMLATHEITMERPTRSCPRLTLEGLLCLFGYSGSFLCG